MHTQTGEPISGIDHIRQSLRDILTTPVGSRVMRRDYGCSLMSLLDRPMNAKFVSDVQVAVSMAVTHFESRIQLSRVIVELPSDDIEQGLLLAAGGKVRIHIEGTVMPDGQQIVLRDILQV